MALDIQVQVLQGDVRARKDIPEQRFARLRRRQQVLVVRRHRTLNQFLLEHSPRIALAQSQLATNEVEMSD